MSGPAPAPAPSAVPDHIVEAAFAPPAGRRRVLVFAPLAFSTPHFETDLEIAQRHLDLGDEVELVLCDGDMASCQLNPLHEPRRCVQCISRNLQGAAQLSARVPILNLHRFLTREDERALAGLPAQFPDQATLAAFAFEGFDAGLAALSSVIDFVRTPDVDLQGHAALIQRTVHAAARAFLAFRRLLAARRYDRAYIYNGRWSTLRSAVRACEQAGVPYFTHERGSDFAKFALYPNKLPHDKPLFVDCAREAWRRAGAHPASRAVGEAFFHERRQRVEKMWFSYTKQQETGRLPADWDRPARRIVYFTSSEFEYAAIGEGTSGRIYPSQARAAPHIARLLAQTVPDAHLWVRVHPNDDSPANVEKWTAAAAGVPNLTLIPPSARIDSYAMLDGAERILTFGSTVGIEATFWGKPAICADYSFYNGLDAQYEAATETEMIELLTRPGLPPRPRENALIFGYYMNSFGGEFRHFQTAKISDYAFESPFRGRCLKPDYPDLRTRLLALFQAGEAARSADIAGVCAQFAPADEMVQTIHVLSHLQRGEFGDALEAVEAAAGALAAPQIERVLQRAGKALVDGTIELGRRIPRADFAAVAGRVSTVLVRVPAFEPVGRKLEAIARHALAAPAAVPS